MVPLKPKRVEKTWGHEVWLVNNEEEDYCGKILFIREGQSTSMHYHTDKHETMYVLKGTLMIDGLAGNRSKKHTYSVIVKEGESIEIERDRAHKLIAHGEDVTIIETSTLHRDEDSHRLWR